MHPVGYYVPNPLNLSQASDEIVGFLDQNPPGTGPAGQTPGQSVASSTGSTPQLDGILAGMSRQELEKLKHGLENASMSTGAAIAIGSLVFLIAPGSLTVTVMVSGLAIISIGLQYLATMIDRYLNQKS